MENGSKIRLEINVFFNKGGFGRPGGRRMSIVTTFRSRFGGVRFLMIFRSAKKTSKNWKKLKKCDFGAPGACRPGLAWGRKARKVICAGCSWSLSVAKRLSKVLQTKSSIKNPPLTPSQKMKGAAPIWPLADLQF